MRKDITVNDIEQISRLVDSKNSEVVAKLLVAYAYARDEKQEEKEEINEETTEINETEEITK